jgi:hypothetical protein
MSPGDGAVVKPPSGGHTLELLQNILEVVYTNGEYLKVVMSELKILHHLP